MSNILPFVFNLPAATGDMSVPQLLAFISENLTASQSTPISTYVSSATEPSSDEGAWLNTTLNTWNIWSNDLGGYVPIGIADVSLGYILSATEPDPTIYQLWFVLGAGGYATDLRTYASGAWHSMGFGTPASAGRVPVSTTAGAAPNWRFAGALVGEWKWLMNATAPAGWVSPGDTLSRTIYADLYAVLLASSYISAASGDGLTTFVVPDPRGRAFIAAGTGSGLTARTGGQTGGQETIEIGFPQLPEFETILYTEGLENSTAFTGEDVTGAAITNMMPYFTCHAYCYTGVE